VRAALQQCAQAEQASVRARRLLRHAPCRLARHALWEEPRRIVEQIGAQLCRSSVWQDLQQAREAGGRDGADLELVVGEAALEAADDGGEVIVAQREEAPARAYC
jgi:hypothetical protein